MDLCRACLSTDIGCMITVTDNFVEHYNMLTDINVADGFLVRFCQSCVDTIMYFVEFRNKCISSETALKNMIDENNKLENTIKHEMAEVKLEVDCDNNINTNESSFDGSYQDFGPYIDVIKNDIDIPVSEKPRRSKRNLQKHGLSDIRNFAIEQDISTNRKHLVKKQLSEAKHLKASNCDSIKPKVKKEIQLQLFCGLCSSKFSDFSSLNSHLEEHKMDKCCGICQTKCSHWPELLGHRVQHIIGKKSYCHICHKICANSLSMEFHYLKNHYEGEFKGIQCSQCSRHYDSARKLRKHVRNVHAEKNFICNICSTVLSTRKGLIMHMLKHNVTKLHQCVDCEYKTCYSSALAVHRLRKHSSEKYSCRLCSSVFKKKEYKDRHKCVRDGKWMCAICGKQFNKSYKYSRHIESHEEVGRYRCDRCPAVYKNRANLNIHRDRHDNNPTKQCEFCHRKFYALSTLIKHRRVHTGEKPYVCKICNKGFTGNNNLKVHMKVHGESLIVKKIKQDTNNKSEKIEEIKPY